MRMIGLTRAALCFGAFSVILTGRCWAASPPPIDTGNAGERRIGSLVIMGGAERFEHREFWDEIVSLAGGPNARIAVFPTASLDPIRRGNWVIAALNRSGADAFLVPLAWKHLERDPVDVVSDPEVVDQVRTAGGVFFIGGGQERITRALLREDGRQTPLLEAIWDVYRGGGVIAGTSAGAAIMSRIMYRDPDSVLETLQQGVRMGEEIDRGLGFLPDDWFVDQHCLVRGRFARALVAMVDQGFRFGLGIDENSAVVIRAEQDLRVVGYRGALILDLSQSQHDPELGRFNLENARLTFLDQGDQFDLQTRQVTPSSQKLDDE
ncbi:MAG: cyanophycinase, partial [Planctomycetales bacterium 12-60-4]